MKTTRQTFVRGLLAGGLAAAAGFATTTPSEAQSLSPAEARQIAEEAYIYGYSLVTTEVTRVQMSNVPKVETLRAPMNQFANVPRYPPADYRGVSAPNADTLYSLAWLDLKEPLVFSHPDMGDRFFLFPMVDLWMTIFDSPGARTTGGKAASYLITAPEWKGEVPAGMKRISCPTRYMVILGRTYADGTETITVRGKQYSTRWYKAKGRVEAGETDTQTWYCDDVPGGLVRSVHRIPAIKKTVTTELVEVRRP